MRHRLWALTPTTQTQTPLSGTQWVPLGLFAFPRERGREPSAWRREQCRGPEPPSAGYLTPEVCGMGKQAWRKEGWVRPELDCEGEGKRRPVAAGGDGAGFSLFLP